MLKFNSFDTSFYLPSLTENLTTPGDGKIGPNIVCGVCCLSSPPTEYEAFQQVSVSRLCAFCTL